MAEQTSKRIFPLKKEYARAIAALNRTGILTILPRSKKSGVIGIDGKEYPVPTKKQVQKAFVRNKKLIDRKMRQGFTRLQLTPMAMPVPQLIKLARTAILKHAAAGKLLQAKQKPTGADVPVSVNAKEPIWMWRGVRKVMDTPKLIYFPQTYAEHGHQGLAKKEVIKNTSLCAVPGWSIGLIEPIHIMPQKGHGRTLGGRKQLEGYSTPHEYLRTLSAPAYQGETGWTLEDFLTYFMVRLEATGQVSHDRCDGNMLWLLGLYIPNHMPNSGVRRYRMQLVPVGYWSRDIGRKMYLSAHRTGNRFRDCIARSMVRLGA